ncbi:hypothetical protein [Lysinibacillus sp. SGAir0095]|uniref:hypothetical protein n=1 Tax=Lysinibacillus sp. SGAir0095 TaxID=2070463 RepID=UPI0010CCD70F|nr:hypothetical protein [Lysinibacillus sp. SGAir0095]QCR33576.1 hypothetical protein C1N55_16070 [Lysinibacillus sp. SGAir0095]
MDKNKLRISANNALKVTLKEFFKLTIVLLIIALILIFTVSNIENIFTTQRLKSLLLLTIVLIILRYGYFVNVLYNHLKVVESIDEITESEDGEKVLLSCINNVKIISERFRLKIDIYKSFSPIPVLVLLLSILVSNNTFKTIEKIELYIVHFNINNSLRFIYIIFSIIILIGYFLILMSNYYKYKKALDFLRMYQDRYEDIKYTLEKEKFDREIKKYNLDIKKLELDIKKLQENQ